PAHQRQIVVIGLQGWSVDARTCNAEYSPARATPPTQSSPSLPRQFSVSFCSSSSAPSVATERLQIQLVNWSQIRGPFQIRACHASFVRTPFIFTKLIEPGRQSR